MEIGSKIKNLRLQKGLTQEELGDRCELSKAFISLLESDKTSPSMATLEDILNVLGTDFAHFFKEESSKRVVYGKDDYSVKKDTDLKNEICWLIPNAQKNEMEPILVTIEPGGSTYPDSRSRPAALPARITARASTSPATSPTISRIQRTSRRRPYGSPLRRVSDR